MAGLNPTDPTGEMALTVMLAVNRMQWRKTAERYDQTRREAIAEGKAIGGAPFGYRFKDPTPKGEGTAWSTPAWCIDESAAPIVRELFERKAGGATWLELARWLDDGRAEAERQAVGALAPSWTMIALPHLPGRGPLTASTSTRRRTSRSSPRRCGAGRRTRPGGAPRAAPTCSRAWRAAPAAGAPSAARRSAASRAKAARRRPPRVYTCATPDCKARSTIIVDRLDAEVARQFFAHLDAFHVRAVTTPSSRRARRSRSAPPRSRRWRPWSRGTRPPSRPPGGARGR